MEKKLTLTITPRAKERLSAMGSEFTVVTGQFATPRGPLPLAVCRIGAPGASARTGFAGLECGGLKIWAPLCESYIRNEVIIDLYAVSNMVLPVVLTAILVPPCAGSCDRCSAVCPSRDREAGE
ncbi:MAG: hypothetical protein ACI4NN_05470 [Pyramidobacter sp.]